MSGGRQGKTQENLNKDVARIFHGPESVNMMSDEAVAERMALVLGENGLSAQQKRFVLYVCSGMSPSHAYKAVGRKDKNAFNWLEQPNIKAAIERYQSSQAQAVTFTRDTAHQMYMDTFAVSGNATEMKNVVDSLVRLHGVSAEGNKPSTQVNVQINNMQEKSDEELLSIIGLDESYLDPGSNVIDHEE